jgi:hypothetical protein
MTMTQPGSSQVSRRPAGLALIGSLMGGLLAGCAGSAAAGPPASPVAATAVRAATAAPAPCWQGGAPCVSTTVEISVRAPIDHVFAFVVAEDVLPRVLKRFGPVPAVVGTRILSGPWERVGALREVHTADGGRLHERITHFNPPRPDRPGPATFAYRIFDFQNQLRRLAWQGVGYWIFEARTTKDGRPETHLRWTYSFQPRSAAGEVALRGIIPTFYRGYMKQCLVEIQRQSAVWR